MQAISNLPYKPMLNNPSTVTPLLVKTIIDLQATFTRDIIPKGTFGKIIEFCIDSYGVLAGVWLFPVYIFPVNLPPVEIVRV